MARDADARVSAAAERSGAAPSLLRAAPSMIALLTVMVCGTSTADADLWGHLRFGADFLAQGHPPTHDIYSYSIPGLPWIDHEWLSEVALAWMYARLGVVGLKLTRFACAATTIVALAGAVGETSAGIFVQLAVMFLVTAGLVPEMQLRPQCFTYALLAVVVWLITRDAMRGRSRLWIAIALVALWSNLHGGFVVGIGVLGVYTLAVAARDLFEGRGLARASRLAAIVVGAMLASLVNPYGAGVWHSVIHTISRPPMLERIIEWQRLPVAMREIWRMQHMAWIFDFVIVLVIGGLAAAVAIAPRGGDAALLAVAVVMIAAAFSAFRNLPLALIGSAAPLALHGSMAIKRVRRNLALSAAGAGAIKFSGLTQGVIGLLAVMLAIELGIFSGRIDPLFAMPVGISNFMTEHDLNGNVLCDLVWSDYVLFHRSPQSHVFVDTRWELIYPQRLANDYAMFHDGRPGAKRMLDSYPHDFVIVAARSDIAAMIDRLTGWKLIYQDNVARLYARAGSAAAQIPGVPVTAQAPPSVFP